MMRCRRGARPASVVGLVAIPATCGQACCLVELKRGLKTLDVREYRPLSYPVEFRFYQRYTSHPNRQSGVQFLTHYNTHQRFRVNRDFIDYLHWGKEQGQARLPHRHQRVAFDFHDSLPPTRVEDEEESQRYWLHQDPSAGRHPDLDASFNPYKKVFSNPEHWNRMFSKRRPGEGDIKLDAVESHSLLGPLMTQTDVQDTRYFAAGPLPAAHGRVPGLNAPYLGDPDRKMMQAMSRPLNKKHTLTTRESRFSKIIYMNDTQRNHQLSSELAKELNTELDRATNAVYSKLTVLEAAQSGETDAFCGGVDIQLLGFDCHMSACLRHEGSVMRESLQSESDEAADEDQQRRQKRAEGKSEELLRDSARHLDRADELLRQHAALIFRASAAPRPLMALVNGKCRGTGCGLALASKYCALKDSSEFIFDGPDCGLSPFGGLTRLLSRPETTLKFPGLAEFVMLTGTSLFAGDALRLGWTDLFTTLPDMSYHIQEWFDTSEHMHNDAIAWQLGHLLDTCFRMKDCHSSEMERCALTPVRSTWIEDAFADQPSLAAVMTTLSEMEKVPLTDPDNTSDECRTTPFTLPSVQEGVRVLSKSRLRFTLAPFDASEPLDPVEVRQAAEIFTGYVLERRGSVEVSVHRDREKLRRWEEQREREYHAFRQKLAAPQIRHVYVKVEGCENFLVHFDHTFEFPSGNADSSEEATLSQLKSAALAHLRMPKDREVQLGWYLPTLDSCLIRNDAELSQVLHNDPGIEDPSEELAYPPIYFLAKRSRLFLSEWAFAVKHQLLLACPTALHAAWSLLHEVRGSTSATDDKLPSPVKSLAECLSIEFKYVSRLMRRPDFYAVGQYTRLSADDWESMKRDREVHLHKSLRPLRPLPAFDEVFDRQVEIDGHFFSLRPRWSPNLLQEVTETDCTQLSSPVDFKIDGFAPLHTDVFCQKMDRIEGMVEDAGGVQVLAGLGELKEDGTPVVAPLQSAAHVPTNVDFYEMGRHPWDDTPSSWRKDGFTEGSKVYYEEQYKEAERQVYGSQGEGTYWPSKTSTEGFSGEERSQQLQDRLWGEFKKAEGSVDSWARDLRESATSNKLNYPLEIATQGEKIYDDDYYRWFIHPGQHPNPSGLLRGKQGEGSQTDAELDAFINKLMTDKASGSAESEDGAALPSDVEETEAMAVEESVSGEEDL